MPLTAEGLEALRAADFLDIIGDAWSAELAARGVVGTPDFERDALLGSIRAVVADRLGQLSETLQAVYDARDPNNATGVQLSSLALAVGVTRNEATSSTVVITIGGDAGVAIPEGRTVRGGGVDGLALWNLRADATIGGGGTVDATFDAQVPGATLAPAGTTWDIVTPVLGWNTATSAADAVPGLDRETDDELRTRRQESLQIGGTASARSIRAQLLEVDEVQAAGVIENDTALPVTIEGILVDAHAVAVVLYPSTLSATALDEAVRVIYDNVAAGIQTSGALAATVLGLDLTNKTIRYSFPTVFEVVTAVTVEMEPASPTNPNPPTFAEAEPEIVAAVEAYEADLSIGDDVRTLAILTAVDGVEGVRSASVVLTVPADPSKVQPTGDVSIGLAEIADLTISVVEAP